MPIFERLNKIFDAFSVTEKLIFTALFAICFLASLSLAAQVNNAFLVEIPSHGGTLEEGIIGIPRFINPLLEISDTDRDLTALVYSGLLKASPDGKLINDLSEQYTISPDERVYTFKIRDNVYFHDGAPVTAKDVQFTIEKAQDPFLKSAKRANWDGVEVQILGEKEVSFILRQPYAPFLENATIGILPKHIWKNATVDQFAFSSFNTEPIGSGPYRVTSVRQNSSGLPVRYHLTASSRYALGEPYIENLIIEFYPNEEALVDAYQKGHIEAINGISPATAETLKEKGVSIAHSPLPRIFGVFFNQNQQTLFAEKAVRSALDTALSKEQIVNEVLFGYGTPITGPIPPTIFPETSLYIESASSTEEAIEILEKAGWERNDNGIMEKKGKGLQFSVSTSNVPELKATANIIKKEWEKIGAVVEVKIFESGDLNQNVIRPRKYDALLFGEIVGRDLDLFPFWHSSQRNDPGLNIALYTNITTDKLLDSARVTLDPKERLQKYIDFEAEIEFDIPAIFIYAPEFIYVPSSRVKNINLGKITVPHERFLDIHNWYIETEKVWEFFVRNRTR
ncbi:MAG: hypothetical protein KAR00_03360 [Candidatus Pacebacteria bacterium]|nr:hypothetical protein [Candidatus Paceibacterota bacterium]